MKKVTTELTKESVNITIEAGERVHHISLPVDLISPQVSLQVSAMITSDPKLPAPKVEKNEKE